MPISGNGYAKLENRKGAGFTSAFSCPCLVIILLALWFRWGRCRFGRSSSRFGFVCHFSSPPFGVFEK